MLLLQIKLLSTAPDAVPAAAAMEAEEDRKSPTAASQRQLLPSLTSLVKERESLVLLDVMRVERESAKLLNALSQHRPALEVLSGSVAGCLALTDKTVESLVVERPRLACGELCSRSLMTLTKWLQADSKLVSSLGLSLGLGGAGGGEGLRLSAQTPQGPSEVAVVSTIRVLLDYEAKGVAQQRGRLRQSFTGE